MQKERTHESNNTTDFVLVVPQPTNNINSQTDRQMGRTGEQTNEKNGRQNGNNIDIQAYTPPVKQPANKRTNQTSIQAQTDIEVVFINLQTQNKGLRGAACHIHPPCVPFMNKL